MASKLESDQLDTVGCGRKLFIGFNAGKITLLLFDYSHNCCAIDVKVDGSVADKKSSFKMLGLSFSSILDWDSFIVSIT